jgi:hypothetical protein
MTNEKYQMPNVKVQMINAKPKEYQMSKRAEKRLRLRLRLRRNAK